LTAECQYSVERPPNIFAKPDISSVLENQQRKLRTEVGLFSASSLAPESFAATEAQVITKYSIAPLEIDWTQESAKKEEVAEARPSDFGHGQTFQSHEIVLRITVPFSGDRHLFEFRPTVFPNMVPRAVVREGELEFIYQATQHELARLRQEHDENVKLIKTCVTQTNELLAA
jgi:hypothetical protein